MSSAVVEIPASLKVVHNTNSVVYIVNYISQANVEKDILQKKRRMEGIDGHSVVFLARHHRRGGLDIPRNLILLSL